jgi:dCMP deaminase
MLEDKPEDVTFDEYFLGMVEPLSRKSKDKSTKVGCVIVGPDNDIRTTGYNSFPRGIKDDVPERQERPLKYFYIEHAERNSIYNKARIGGAGLKGCRIYMDFLPCTDCARALINVGIIEIIIAGDTYETKKKAWETRWKEQMAHAKIMLREAGVKVRLYYSNGTSAEVNLYE